MTKMTVQELYAQKDGLETRKKQLEGSIKQMKKRGKRRLSTVQEMNLITMESELMFLGTDIKEIDLKIDRAERQTSRANNRRY